MAILLLNPAHLGKAVVADPSFSNHHYIHGQTVRGKKFSECREFIDNSIIIIIYEYYE
jgi:hypothetical protein